MSSWTGLDFFIFLIFLLNTLLGMSRGGVKEIISMISLCAALVVTIKFTMPLSSWINKSPLITDVITSQFVQNFMTAIEMPSLTEPMVFQLDYSLSLLLCFAGTFSVCEGVLAYSSMMEAFGLTTTVINRKMGAVFGATRGFVIVLVFIILLEHLYAGNGSAFSGNVPASGFINLLGSSAKKLDGIIIAEAPERYQEILPDKKLYDQSRVLKDLSQPN